MLLLPLHQTAQAASPRSASLVVDANTGAVLQSKGADDPVYPASLTKMMTLYMTFELIEMGRLSYSSKIKMTEEGADAAPSKLDLKPGEELTVLDAIKALVTKSANDVAIALGQHIAGSEVNFARLMTKRARELGMSKTTFRNASGLPNPDQVTTARDMVTLGLRLQDDFPRHYRLFATREFTFRGKTYRNHNGLLARYRGTDGIKTGYTRASGFNLVSSVRRDGKHVVAAVFGGKTARIRNARMQSLITAALPKASTAVTRKPALIARAAPKPVPARQPVRVAAAAPRAEPPPPAPRPAPPQAAQSTEQSREATIAVAKVRSVRIDEPWADLAPDTATAQFAVASADADMPRQPVRASADFGFPRFVPETGALRPSTLAAQAAHLERVQDPTPAPAARLAPAPAVQSSARGGFEIQIGAYGDSAEAEKRISAARQRAGGMLDAYRAVAIPVQGGKLYRARFQGFTSTAANDTCTRLRGMRIDCFVARPQ
ncbi:D-alanyl-D-alanine carboxypeptidase [Hyphomicrobium sp. 1Nfss2.1]|uniref:D-alanyl-D-alanine carboxypeptidase n=1 Tax=Hyphomicrobium sp. 1Nfss2.1 TaxID=3413936 RepID=UPI003C7E178B